MKLVTNFMKNILYYAVFKMAKSRVLVFLFTAILCCSWSPLVAATLSIGSNDSGIQYLPIYSKQADRRYIVQFIYSSGQLSAMNGKQITKMSFPYRTAAGVSFSNVQVRLKEVSESGFSSTSFLSISGATLIYSNSVNATSTTVEITFSTPFVYHGGNLLVDVRHPTAGGSYVTGNTNGKCKATSASSNVSLYNYTTSSTMPTTGTQSMYRPDVIFTYENAPAAACPDPTSLAVPAANITSDSVQITWTKGEAAASTLEYKLHSASTWTVLSTSATSPYILNGLSASMQYDVRVKNSCDGGTESNYVSTTFTTDCAPESIPYTYGFEDVTTGSEVYNIPDCWKKITQSSYYPSVQTTSARSGSKHLYMSVNRSVASYAQYIILPLFEEQIADLQMSFYYKTYAGNNTEDLQVGYVTNPTDASTFMATSGTSSNRKLALSNSIYSQAEVKFSGAPNNARIAIRLLSTTDYYGATVFIDDINVNALSSCDTPTGLTASAVSATSANLSWTKGSDETAWNVQYSSDGGSTWTPVNNVAATVVGTSCSYTLTLPSDNTTYEIQVQADCGSAQSNWTSSATVTTPCAVITSEGWSDDFESATAGTNKIPDCYEKLSGTNYPSYPQVYEFHSYAHSGNKSLQFYGGGTTSEEIIILPEFTEATNTLAVTLWYKNYDTRDTYPQLQVGYITDPTDASTFSAVIYGDLERVTSYTEATVSLIGAPVGSRIAIKYAGGGTNEDWTYIDDISISLAPPCLEPGTITKSNMTSCSVTLSWTAGGSETGWNLQYKPYGGVFSEPVHLTSPSYDLTDLTPGTTYYYQVQADCDGPWTTLASYTPVCPVPGAPTFSNETYNSVRVSWTAGSCESSWNLRYKKGNGSWTTVSNLTSTYYDLENMETGATYSFQVQAGCGGTWSAIITYTPTCPTITDVTLTNQTYSSVQVNWTASGTGTYSLRYKVNSILSPVWTTINNIGTTSYTIENLIIEVEYIIQVKPTCSNDWSDEITYTPRILPPTPVITAYDGSAKVQWELVLGASGYQYICVPKDAAHDWDDATLITTNPTAGSPLVISGLAASTDYDLYVRSTYGVLHSIHSVERKQSFTTITIAPENLTNTDLSLTTAAFEWNKNENSSATFFQWACTSGSTAPSAGDWHLLESGVRTAEVDNLSSGTAYTFYVRTYYSEGVYSDAVSLAFTTLCDSYTLPYSEDFNAWTTELASCWHCDRWESSKGHWYSEDGTIRYYADSYSLAAEIRMPLVELSEQAELSFSYSNNYSHNTIPSTIIISNGTITKTISLPTTASGALDSRYITNPIDLTNVDGADFTGSVVSITFRGQSTSNSTGYFHLDDLKIESKTWIYTGDSDDGLWKTKGNWNKGTAQNRVPAITDDVIVRAPATVDAATVAKAKSVIIDRAGSRTGRIDILPQGELIIQNTLRQATGEIGSAVLGATSADYLSVATSEDGNGVLAIGSHTGANLNNASVSFYTKSYKHETDGYINQFIGTPFCSDNDIYVDYYGSYIYKYDAIEGWINQKRGTSMVPFAGYNILRKDAEETTLWMQGTLCASDNQTLNLTYAGEPTQNMIANSWMAPVDIASMADAFTNCEATVYLFNAGSKKQNVADGGDGTFGGSSSSEGASSPGQFIALPVASAPWISPAIRVIPSMQAFIVIANGASPSVSLDYASMVLNPLKNMENETATAATRAPKRLSETDKPDILRLHVAGTSGNADVLYLLIRQDFTTTFDNGYDGRKLGGNTGIPYLYAFSQDGEMSIHCIPDAEGTRLGFEPGEDTRYRITFAYDGNETLYLNDLQAHTSTRIQNDYSYDFSAAEGDDINRFDISATPIAQVTTGCSNGGAEAASVRKVMINGCLYIIRGNARYTVTGEVVK